MAIVEITAHVGLGLASAEADVLAWLDSQGLEVTFGEATHLIAFPQEDVAADAQVPVAELHLYPLDGGIATQVRWRLRGDGLVEALLGYLHQSTDWTTDGCWGLDQHKG